MPPSLLEEVFELNEQLDEIRELREGGADPAQLRPRLDAASGRSRRAAPSTSGAWPQLSEQWDRLAADAAAAERRATLTALRECVLERNYINNLIATIEREGATRMGKVVGIDLGTTNSLVAYVKDGTPVVIRDGVRRRAGAVGRVVRRGRHRVRRAARRSAGS